MKKIINLLILIILIFSFIVPSSYASFFDDAQEHKYAADIRLLCNLGIINGDEEGNFNPDNPINRIEFLTIMLRTLYNDQNLYLSATDEYAFDDVPNTHWAYHESCFMRMMGLTEGVGNNKFDPNATISLRDAVKIIISALGYKDAAESRGGYPEGYLQVAYSIGLMDRAVALNGEAMTRAEVARLIAGALDVEENTDDRSTLLEKRGFIQLDGIVESVFELQLGQNLDENQIQIGGKVYKTNIKLFPCPSIELVGRHVSAYYSPKEEEIVHLNIKGSQNIITIKSRDIVGTPTLTEYKYKDTNGKTRSAKISNAVVIYNGELISSGSINSTVLKPASGEVSLIDTDSNNSYDMIYVKGYELVTVSANREGMIYGRLGNQVDLRDCEYVYIYYGNTEVSLNDIKADDVLSVMKSPSGEKAWVHISRETAEGMIESYRKDGEDIVYDIEGEERYLSSAYMSKMDSSYGVSMNLGEYRKIYLDIYGEVAFAEAIEADKEYPNYAYLMEVDTDSRSGLTGTVAVRLLTSENKFQYFAIPTREKIRFGRLDGGSYKISKEDGETIGNQLKSYIGQLVTYEWDGEETLTKICLPGKSGDRENLSADYYSTEAEYSGRVIADSRYVDVNTVCFGIPFSGKYEEYLQVGKYNDILSSGKNNVILYDVEPDGRVGALIRKDTIIDRLTESKGEYEVILDPVNSPIIFVNKIVSMADEEDEWDRYAVGYCAGVEVKVRIGNNPNKNSESLDVFKPGNAVQYVLNDLERSRAETSENTERVVVAKKVFDFTQDNMYKTTYAYNDTYYNLVSGVSTSSLKGMVCTYDVIKEVSSGAIVLDKSGFAIQKNNGIAVMSYNRSTGEFEIASIEDLQVGMEIFTRRRYSNAIEIVYMKD